MKNENNMKKIVLLGLIGLLIGGSVQAQLLYKISGKDLKNSSYLIGTHHLAPVTFVDSIPGLKEALNDCKQVYGELDMMDLMKPENLAKMQAAQMMPEGKTISELLTKEQMDRLNEVMREVMGVDMNNEAAGEQLNKLSPAALSTTLSMMATMKRIPGFNIADPFDGYFQKVALAAGKTVKGFETVEFQMEVLFGASLEEQVKDLMCQLEHFSESLEMMDFITTAFFAQDLEQLGELFQEEMEEGPCTDGPEENAKLIDDRNVNWLKQMPSIMEEAPTFFAVGAGHLVGEKGLLNQLREMGYKVEGVK